MTKPKPPVQLTSEEQKTVESIRARAKGFEEATHRCTPEYWRQRARNLRRIPDLVEELRLARDRQVSAKQGELQSAKSQLKNKDAEIMAEVRPVLAAAAARSCEDIMARADAAQKAFDAECSKGDIEPTTSPVARKLRAEADALMAQANKGNLAIAGLD